VFVKTRNIGREEAWTGHFSQNTVKAFMFPYSGNSGGARHFLLPGHSQGSHTSNQCRGDLWQAWYASLYGDRHHVHRDHLISRYRARHKSALCTIILVRSEDQMGKALWSWTLLHICKANFNISVNLVKHLGLLKNTLLGSMHNSFQKQKVEQIEPLIQVLITHLLK